MSNFTTEAKVREKFQVNDTAWSSPALVTSSIDDAHIAVLRALDPEVDTETPDDGLVLGETLLAGANLLRSLASKDAGGQAEIVVGGQRLSRRQRFASLMTLGERAEREAWEVLEPYVAGRPVVCPGVVTDSVPVLGSGDSEA